jgi:hypothetical protein
MRRQLAVNSNTSAQDMESIQTVELLGEGTFGKVYKGLWRGSVVAVSRGLLRCLAMCYASSRSHVQRRAAVSHQAMYGHSADRSMCRPVIEAMQGRTMAVEGFISWWVAVMCLELLLHMELVWLPDVCSMFSLGVSSVQVKTMLLPANMSGAEKREKM